MKKILILTPLCLFWMFQALGQTNFRDSWQKADPVEKGSTLGLEEKVKLHQDFLDLATRTNDKLNRLYGLLYLFYDHVNAHNFPEASRYLLEAESLAKTSGNPGWQGWVAHRRGVLCLRMHTYEDGIAAYKSALMLCSIAGDSLCMGEALEQLGAMYDHLDDSANAQQCFERALPLVMKYGADAQVASALNNFGSFLIFQERETEAISYINQALTFSRRAGDERQATILQNNLAIAYRQLKLYDQALKIYRQCIKISQEKGWLEDLPYNYRGMSLTFERTGQYHEALDFFKQYHYLNDSLIGAKTQKEIGDLETRYAVQQKELELDKSQIALSVAERSLERGLIILIGLLTLVAFILWRWREHIRGSKLEQTLNKESLEELTRVLLEKNTLLSDLEAKMSESPESNLPSGDSSEFEENLYNQRILTHADWAGFKGYFEKAYPGYLGRLRASFAGLTDAEQRLFLFIKLNLTTREVAAILGISVDSVKRTRNRLRHRLALGEETELEVFIRAF